MYLSLGNTTIIYYHDIVGIFDLDNTTQSRRTKDFLNRGEQEGKLTALGDDLPKSFVVCSIPGKGQKIYVVKPSSSTLKGRIETNSLLTGRQ